jgi:sugar O-acyltransferase (sialic acid O-acetyltransferase NeuD family)
MERALVVIGSGGHAKVVIATAQAAGFSVTAVVDDEPGRWGHRVLGVPVAGPTASTLEDPEALAVLAIGANRARQVRARGARCRFATIVHPGAIVHPSVRFGDGSVVFAGAVIQPDAAIGGHAIINTGASIDHDCVLGDFVHIAPGVRLAGSVTLGDGVMLGIGTVAIPGSRVGAWTTVGAGAAILGELPENVIAIGTPARPRG